MGDETVAINFKRQRQSNDTQASTTGVEAKLARGRRGKESPLTYADHPWTGNSNGLLAGLRVMPTSDSAEVRAADALPEEQRRQGKEPDSPAADKGHRQRGLVQQWRGSGIKPHTTPNEGRRALAVDGCTAGGRGDPNSQ